MKKKLKQLLSDQFLRNSGWLGAGELLNRISRLVTTVVLARMFTTADYGSLAVISLTFSFGNIFVLRGGIGSKIIQAEEEDIEAICQTAYWLNWILCICVFIAQLLLAWPLSLFYKNSDLILPIMTVSLIYLTLPHFMVQGALIRRANKLKLTALTQASLNIVTNIFNAGLAFLGWGVWSAVWGMLISYTIQIFLHWRLNSWRPPNRFTIEKWREVMRFGLNILGVSLLEKLRLNLDYMIVGGFLGVDALGLYYFAFNAGIGISSNVINVFTSSIFPYLCVVNDNLSELKKRFISSLKKTAVVIIPLLLIQSSLAPFYVPIIFGEKWISAVPILVIICLSALPLAIYNPTKQLLNAVDKTQLSFYWNIIFTLLFGSVLLLVVKQGIMAVALSVLACQFLTLFFCIWAIRNLFNKTEIKKV